MVQFVNDKKAMNWFKVISMSIFGFILTVIILTILSSAFLPHLNEAGVKRIIHEKAGLEIKSTINIKKYENTGFAISDFAETYQVELEQEEFNNVTKQVQDFVKQGRRWKKIERGYQLTIPQKTNQDTIFIFLIDVKKKWLKVQIVEE